MLFIINAEGTIIKTFPSHVYQGSNEASDIIVLAPFARATMADVGFMLPNGAWTKPTVMTSNGAIELEGASYNTWRTSLPYEITEYSGTVTAQFRFYTGTLREEKDEDGNKITVYQLVTTSAATFTVQAGAAIRLPDTPSGDYAKIMGAITQLGHGLTNTQAEVDALEGIVDGQGVELESKLTKVETSDSYARAYAISASGEQTEYIIDNQTAGNSLAQRNEAGQLAANDPTRPEHVVNLTTQNQAISAEAARTDAAIEAAKVELKAYTDQELAAFDFIKIVDVLPETGLPNHIYLVPKADSEGQDLFDEYIWANGAWEFITTKKVEVDLTDYATKTELTDGLAGKLDKFSIAENKKTVYGVEGDGSQVRFTLSNAAEANTIARRTTGGALSVGPPTEPNHAASKDYVDSKTFRVFVNIASLNWQKGGQAGPDATNDIAWSVPLSDIGITNIHAYKGYLWTIGTSYVPYETGSLATIYDFPSIYGGKVNLTTNVLVMIGPSNPASVYDGETYLSFILLA